RVAPTEAPLAEAIRHFGASRPSGIAYLDPFRTDLEATQGSARDAGEGDALKLASRKLPVVKDRRGSESAHCVRQRVFRADRLPGRELVADRPTADGDGAEVIAARRTFRRGGGECEDLATPPVAIWL